MIDKIVTIHNLPSADLVQEQAYLISRGGAL
jgi:hypothetical protein